MFLREVIIFGFFLTWPAVATAAPCYDLSKGEPARLTGLLSYEAFAGPPNHENAQKRDTAEPSFVLRLAHPICIQRSDSADPKASFRQVQLVQTPKVRGKLKALLHREVSVTLKAPAVETGQRQPLFAWLTDIAASARQVEFTNRRGTAASTRETEFAKEHETATNTHQIDFTGENGTPATTVTAFYAGLAGGRGDIASARVVPQKRAHGPFSAGELSHFYGHLKEPIRLVDVEVNGPSKLMVHYRYAASARECNGRALVKTVVLSGKNYIESIHALDHC